MKDKPIILMLESATEVCSVALSKGSEVLAVCESFEGNRHSEWMTTFIEDALFQAQVSRSDIDAVAVSQGPGSYTGLRVAYSVAKGITYALQLPMIEVDTLESLAVSYINQFSPTDGNLIIPMIDARRMEVYQRLFNHKGLQIDELSATILEKAQFEDYFNKYDKVILLGNGATKVRNLDFSDDLKSRISIHDEIVCSAAHMSPISLWKFENSKFSDVAYCVPRYLKSPNITTSTKHRLVKS